MIGCPSRRQFLALAAGSVATTAGCVASTGGAQNEAEGSTVTPDDVADKLPTEDHAVPLTFEFEDYAEEATSGGVEKDGIPSIDDPQFGDIEEGNEQMAPGDIVFGVAMDGEARAYPQRILVHHEIVNDSFADRGVVVTYCPLTGTAIGFDRGEVEFGVSGQLVNSNLIMYDRATDAWWPQVLGTSVLGSMKGHSLVEFPVVWTTWERWREAYPDTAVLTEDTGSVRDYNSDPYGTYNPRSRYYDDSTVMFSPMTTDDRYHPKKVFLGARSSDGAVAFDKDRLREQGVLEVTVNGVPYLAAYDDALDFGWVYRNPNEVVFESTDDGYVENGDQYAADSLPLDGINAFDAMWFAWTGFYPDSAVV